MKVIGPQVQENCDFRVEEEVESGEWGKEAED